MSRSLGRVAAIGVAVTAVLSIAVAASANRSSPTSAAVVIPAFSTAELLKDPGADYVTNLGNLQGTNHSSLTEITPANVTNLKVAWHMELTAPNVSGATPPQLGGSSAMPLAYKGVLFTEDAFNRVYATDAATGKNLWVYDPKLAPYGKVIPYSVRGLAIGDGKVFLAQGDAVLTAIDANTGEKVWSNAVGKLTQGLFFTAAPLYYDGMVLTGTSGGDTGGNCIFVALDSKTGKVLWHWNAIPTKKGHVGFDTWVPVKKRAWVGGGAMWSTPTVDPKLGLVYISVGNPIPYILGRPPGKEVPTNSVVALHVKTGKPAWAYQTIHHDIWDFDMSNHPTLADITYKGKSRRAIIAVNKNGYAYVLDRATGKPILPIPEVKVPQSKTANTWPTQPIPQGGAGQIVKHTVDPGPWAGVTMPDGKPPLIGSNTAYPPIDDTHYTVSVRPGLNQWQHNSYDPKTGNLYVQALYRIYIQKALPAAEVLPNLQYQNGVFGAGWVIAATAGTPAATANTARLVAFNPAKNKVSWVTEYENNLTTPGALGNFTGIVTTSSGVLFVGRLNGYLEAYDSSSGKLLWTSPKLVAGTSGAPVVFSVNGKETVGLYAGRTSNVGTGNGSELYAFQLP
jgi:PQQ-dependent dehydrogenase (methanol/ethanol family)